MKTKEKFLIEATKQYGNEAILTKEQVKQVCNDANIKSFGFGQLVQAGMSAGKDKIKLESVDVSKSDNINVVQTNIVNEVKEVAQDNASVNLMMSITIETDEDDLLGGFRLVNGETKFVPGPVIEAMERGCTLLLDECDLGSNKLMCLQPVLEGKGVYLKKVNKWVTPKNGFNVMATANTKGKGSEDGRFIGTNILNEAFLERFAVTIEQPYASNTVEKKIVLGSMKKYGKVDEKFAENLVQWAEVIRKTFYDGGVDEVISTRRLDHIVKAFAIFGDKMKSLDLCVARFDEDTKVSFLDLYSKIDAGVDPLAETESVNETEEEDEAEPPF